MADPISQVFGGGPFPAGSYIPTVLGSANLTAQVVRDCLFSRVGNLVHIFGSVDMTVTVAATSTQLFLSLPLNTSPFINTIGPQAAQGIAVRRAAGGLGSLACSIDAVFHTQANAPAVTIFFVSDADTGVSRSWKFALAYVIF